MKAATKSASSSSGHNMEMTGLIILGVYVTMMPKELSHLIFAVIGAGTYLFFLTMQPSIDLLNSKKTSPDEKDHIQKNTTSPSVTPNESPSVSPNESPNMSPTGSPKLIPQSGPGSPDVGLKLVSKPIATAMASTDITGEAKADSPKLTKGVCCPRFQHRLSDADMITTKKHDNVKHHSIKLSDLEREKQTNFEEVRNLLAEHLADTEKPKKKGLSADAPEWTGFVSTTPLSTTAAPFVYTGCSQVNVLTNVDVTPFLQPMFPTDNGFNVAMPTSFDVNAMSTPTPSPPVLPEGISDNACWDWVTCGFCQRGNKCRWEHPPQLQCCGQSEVQMGNGNFVQPGWQPQFVESVFGDPGFTVNGGVLPMDNFN